MELVYSYSNNSDGPHYQHYLESSSSTDPGYLHNLASNLDIIIEDVLSKSQLQYDI